MDYKDKYLKYKNKYLQLKTLLGGGSFDPHHAEFDILKLRNNNIIGGITI